MTNVLSHCMEIASSKLQLAANAVEVIERK